MAMWCATSAASEKRLWNWGGELKELLVSSQVEIFAHALQNEDGYAKVEGLFSARLVE